MNYFELYIPTADSLTAEIYMAELSDHPFESFELGETFLKAYIREDDLRECRSEVESFLRTTGVKWLFTEIETVNWNKEWESNFPAVEIDQRLRIRAPFHTPSTSHKLEVVIMPKMSFGTGHHATTHLMAEQMLGHDFSGKRGLDMGSGTGVLAILAIKLGATHMDAIDIDQWAYDNCIENIETNGVSSQITPLLGDVSIIKGKTYDFILANINTNVLLADMEHYAQSLNDGGELMISGILDVDIPQIQKRAETVGFIATKNTIRDGWAMMLFRHTK